MRALAFSVSLGVIVLSNIVFAGGDGTALIADAARAAKQVIEKSDLARSTKPSYKREGDLLLYHAQSLPTLTGTGGNSKLLYSGLVQLQCEVEVFSKYPPPGMAKTLLDKHTKKMAEAIAESYRAAREEKDPDNQIGIFKDADNRLLDMIKDAIDEHAAMKGLKAVQPAETDFPITVKSIPEGGKIYLITDMQKYYIDLEKMDLRKVIRDYAISNDQTFLEGKVWYLIEWSNKTSGPTSTVITSKEVTLR